jgi:hypothetical protein
MHGELVINGQDAVVVYLQAVSRHSPGRTIGNHKDIVIRISDAGAENRIIRISNTSQGQARRFTFEFMCWKTEVLKRCTVVCKV